MSSTTIICVSLVGVVSFVAGCASMFGGDRVLARLTDGAAKVSNVGVLALMAVLGAAAALGFSNRPLTALLDIQAWSAALISLLRSL